MTKQEKTIRVNRTAKRMKRLLVLCEHLVDNYDVLDAVMVQMRYAITKANYLMLISQPTDDLVCVGGYAANGKRIQ